jgi:zinc protease
MRLERYRLDNGLDILLHVDNRAPVVCFQTWFSVGSRHEYPGKTGIAHLLEHLMFGETENRAHGAYDELLEAAGADNNAATYLDWTYYTVSAPAEALPLVIDLESDRMQNLVLREEPVASEREVVASERRQTVDDDVDGKLSEILYANAFSRHGYRWPTIGTMEDIQGLTTQDCRDFYKTYYAPNNAKLVIVGDMQTGEVLAQIEAAYGGLVSAVIPAVPDRAEPEPRASSRVEVRLPAATAKLAIAYPSPAMASADHAVLELVNEVLFGGRASRAHRRMVQEAECATDVRAYVGPFVDASLYEIHATAREGTGSGQLLDAVDEVIASLESHPLTADELLRARSRLELGILQGMDTVAGRAEQIGFYDVVLADPGAIFDRITTYASVTAAKANDVARRYLRAEPRTVVQVEPSADDGEVCP